VKPFAAVSFRSSSRVFSFPFAASDRRRLLLLVLSGALALFLGWIVVTPLAAEKLIAAGGYYYLLGVFAGFVFFAWRAARARRDVWLAWLRRPGWVGAALAVAVGFVLWSDTFQHKVLFDEYVLQATAWHMHATKEIGTVVRAYDLFGTWQPIDTFLDKRPYFFTFLLSLVHDLTGYRLANVFVLNSALLAAFLALTYWFARQLTNRTGGLLAVGLLATLPLLGQNATGAGMEMHNLAMLLFTMCAALLYLRAPDADRAALLCLSAVLLAQSRYESVIFVGPVALVLVAGWWRARRVVLPWIAIAAPLLLVPYAWQSRVVTATPLLWQLREGETARFSVAYLAKNLAGAGHFFFNFGPRLANSWFLSALGLTALVWAVASGVRKLRARSLAWVASPDTLVLLAFGAGVAANLALLMFYYWSQLDDVIASRFALPACMLLALVSAIFVVRIAARWPIAPRAAFAGIGIFLLVSGLPAMASRFYTSQNLVMQEVDWEHDVVMARHRRPLLFISNMSTIPWVLWKIPVLLNHVAVGRGPQIAYHLGQGTFTEVLVAQALRPTSAEGKFGIDPDDVMPPAFHLEPITEKRFGGRIARISRLVAIDPTAEKNTDGSPSAAAP